jgi:hypothetical protein
VRPVVRGAIAAAALLVLAAPLAGAAGAAPGQDPQGAAPKTPSPDAAILDLVGCVQGSGRLEVLMLIDESASLKVTDPDNRRVDAAQAALDSLLSLAAESGSGGPKVDVALAAFSNAYRSVTPWTAVGPDTTATLRASIERFRRRNRGTDTDFVNALTGARESLADQSALVTANGGRSPCKAVLLFTDGQYDIAVRDAKSAKRLGRTKRYAPGVPLTNEANVRKVEAAGREELCRDDGLADGVRRDEITLLTVALSGRLPAAAQRLLAAASAGIADGTTCGKPTFVPPGAYLPAAGVDALIAKFDEVATRIAGGTLLPGGGLKICGADPCPTGSRTVVVDPSVRRVRFLALAAKPGMVVDVATPTTNVRLSSAGSARLGAAKVTTRSVAGRGFTVDIDRPAGAEGWTGTWTISLLSPSGALTGQPATLQVYVFSEIGVAFGKLPQVVRGKAATFTATLSAPKGVKPASLIKGSSAVLRLDDPIGGESVSVPLTGGPVGPYTGTFTAPASYTSISYDASIELRATTKDGAQLVSRSAPQSILVRRPGNSVQFAPALLQMASLTGTGETTADLILLGGPKAGCVWFGRSKATAPPEAGEMTVTYDGRPAGSEATCIKVPANKSLTIPVAVSPDGRATGSVRGTLEVHEKVTGNAATVTSLPYRFDLARGVDEAQRLVLAAAFLAGGLLFPMLLLLLLNAVSARFQTLDAVQGASLPVQVTGTTIFRLDEGRPKPFDLYASDFRSLSGAGHARRFAFGGIEFRARASRNPFGGTTALAAPEGGAEKLKGRVGSKVELDPGLAGSWVFLLDPDRTRTGVVKAAEGDLIVFIAEGDANVQTTRMLPDLQSRLPDTASRLANLVRNTAPPKKHKLAPGPGPAPSADGDPTDGPDGPDGPGGPDGDATPPPAPQAPTGFGGVAEPPPPASAPATPPPAGTNPPVGFGGVVPPERSGD